MLDKILNNKSISNEKQVTANRIASKVEDFIFDIKEIDAIISVVQNDDESKYRIKSWIALNIPASNEISLGTIANLGLWLKSILILLKDEGDTENYNIGKLMEEVCTGIADSTSIAINLAIKNDKLPFIEYSKPTSRILPLAKFVVGLPGVYGSFITVEESFLEINHHTATLVKFKNNIEIIIDWHHTLDIQNPLIYYSEKDFINDTDKKILYSDIKSKL